MVTAAAAGGFSVVGASPMPMLEPVVPARFLVAILETRGFGSLLGDVFLGMEAAATLFVAFPPLLLLLLVVVLLRPAVGCLSERDRVNAEVEVDDDMVTPD